MRWRQRIGQEAVPLLFIHSANAIIEHSDETWKNIWHMQRILNQTQSMRNIKNEIL